MKSETSPGRISRKSTCCSGGRWCDSRASRILFSYASRRPSPGRIARMRTGAAARRRGGTRPPVESGCTPWIRSSVERRTREIIDVTMIVAMNHEAILMPSGRS